MDAAERAGGGEVGGGMKERPARFNDQEVRAILDGRKTQTRLVVKFQPEDGEYLRLMGGAAFYFCRRNHRTIGKTPCPYGVPGDRLWVREAWCHYQPVLNLLRRDGAPITEISDGAAAYRADGFDSIEECRDHLKMLHGRGCEAIEINGDRWRPSIHMPRWASRITLEVTAVRVERLQEISEEDATAEGVEPRRAGQDEHGPIKTHRTGFVYLWQELNAKRGYLWESNPWVWVIDFKRAEAA